MNEERYIQFEQYLQEEMTVEERKKFEKQVLEDEEIAVEFSAFKLIISSDMMRKEKRSAKIYWISQICILIKKDQKGC